MRSKFTVWHSEARPRGSRSTRRRRAAGLPRHDLKGLLHSRRNLRLRCILHHFAAAAAQCWTHRLPPTLPPMPSSSSPVGSSHLPGTESNRVLQSCFVGQKRNVSAAVSRAWPDRRLSGRELDERSGRALGRAVLAALGCGAGRRTDGCGLGDGLTALGRALLLRFGVLVATGWRLTATGLDALAGRRVTAEREGCDATARGAPAGPVAWRALSA